MGHVLVMGRRTYESIGRPLPGRETWILTRSGFTAPGTRSCFPKSRHWTRLQRRIPGTFLWREDPKSHQLYGDAVTYTSAGEVIVPGDAFFPPFEEWFARWAWAARNRGL